MTGLFLHSSTLKNVTCDCSSAAFSYIFQRQHCLFWMVSSPALSPLTQAVPSLSHLPALCSHILPIPVWSAGKCHAAAPQPLLPAPSCLLVVNSLFTKAQRTARDQTLVLQKSWRISAHQATFMSAELLFPIETSSVWIFSKYMRQSIDQNANEQTFFSSKKTSCIFRTHWCVTSGLSLTEKNTLTFVTNFNLKLFFL